MVPNDTAPTEPERVETRTPEQEIEERFDLRRLDPKRWSDPKVLK